MTHELCLDPECKGCRWWRKNEEAIRKRMRPPKEKPEPKSREREQ